MQHRLTFWILFWMTLIGMFVFGGLMINSAKAETPCIQMDNLTAFLTSDTTDQRVYNPGPLNRYDCGYFSSDLAANASKFNISLGTIILEPDYGDYHVMNYVYINDSLVIIEPQSDKLYSPFEVGHRGFTAGMLLPWQTEPIVWVCGFKADVNLF